MNKNSLLLVCFLVLFSIRPSWGQNYIYSHETPNVYDKNCRIAEEYLKEHHIPKGWKYNRRFSALFNLTNGYKLVVIEGERSFTEKQVLYSTNGNGFLTNNGWTDHVNKLKENTEVIHYAIIINNKGNAIKAIKVCSRFAISALNDDCFILLAGNEFVDNDIEFKSYYTYQNIFCFNNNGEQKWVLWTKKDDILIYDYDCTQNYLYIVGNSKGFSCYKTIDIKTGKILKEEKVAANSTYIQVECEGNDVKALERVDNNIYAVRLGQHYTNGGKLVSTIDTRRAFYRYSPEEYKKQTGYQWEELSDIEDYFESQYKRYKEKEKLFGKDEHWKNYKVNIVPEIITGIEKEETKANEIFELLLQMAKDSGLPDEEVKIKKIRMNFFKKSETIKKKMR